MHQNPEAHFKRVQSLKFFSILKQKQPQGFSNYFTSAFLSNIYRQLNRMSTAVYINDKKINEQLFADIFSQYYQPHLCSYADLVNFYLRIRDVFTSQYQSQDQMTKLNKEIFLSKFDKQSKENYAYQISVIAEEIRQNVSYESYEDIIVKFNYCFMSFYLDKENFLKGFYEICRIFMQKVIIQTVLKEISCKHYEEESYKSLLFICDAALSFPDLHKLLTISVHLQRDYWPIFRDSLFRFINEDESKQGVTLVAFFNVFMRLKPDFIEFLLIFLAQDNNHFNLIEKSHKLIHNLAYTRQLIEFYAFLLDSNFNRYQYFLPKMVLDIQYYAVKVLNSNQRELFCASISLINETIKYNVENDAIMIIFQALQANDLHLNQTILLVLQTGLRVNNSQIVETLLVRRARYIPILLRQLAVPIKQEFSSHCLCLEIIHLMIRPDFFLCFGDILKCLDVALEASDAFTTQVSEILKQICIFLQGSEITSRLVSSQSIFKVALKLLSLYDRKDVCMELLQFEFPFIKKQFIRNITEIFISYFHNQTLIKEAEKSNACHQLLYDAYYFFGKLIGNCGVSPYLLEFLKEQIQVKGFKKKIYAAIFAICQNIIFFFGNTEIPVKIRMQQPRKSLLACFYQYFTYQELINEKIPILIEFTISFELHRFLEVERLLPVGTTYQLFQTYCREIMKEMAEKQRYQHEIRPIYFKDRIHGNAQVRDASSYRMLIDRCLKDSKKQYKISIFIEQENYPANSYESMPSVSISPFNTGSTNFQSQRNSPRIAVSQVLSNRSSPQSVSPGRQAGSRMMPSQNSPCRECGLPSPHILCEACNRK